MVSENQEIIRCSRDNPGAVLIYGHGEADLGVIRALGERGVPIYLLTDSQDAPACFSRYVNKCLPFPATSANESDKLENLIKLGKRFENKPVFFSTGDTSLLFFSRHRKQLEPYYKHHLSDENLIETLYDKSKFIKLAEQHALAVPSTISPKNLADLERQISQIVFPVIVKPIEKRSWKHNPKVRALIGNDMKGVRIESAQALIELFQAAAALDSRMVIQRYIEGRDEQIFSLHIYIDKQGQTKGWFTGQKIRTYPIHRGVGCFQLSVINRDVAELGRKTLQSIGYTGHAIVQVKQEPDSGEIKIFEINCRYSTWNYLHTKSGVNLPFLAYQDSLGLETQTLPEQKQGPRWINVACDIKAFKDYHRIGEWNWGSWLRTYLGSNCYAKFSFSDPGPLYGPFLKRAWCKFRGTSISIAANNKVSSVGR